MTKDPIEIEELLERVSGNREFAIRMLELFFSTSHDRLNSMQDELSQGNYEELAEQAHKLRGIVGNLSINRAMTALGEIHQMARIHQEKEIRRLLTELELSISEARDFFAINPSLTI